MTVSKRKSDDPTLHGSTKNLLGTGYAGLANAIVALAVKDYRRAVKRLGQESAAAKCLERFFFSNWFMTLTNVDPRLIVKKV